MGAKARRRSSGAYRPSRSFRRRSCTIVDVLRLHLPNEPGNLAEVAQALGDAGITIDYAYSLTSTVPGEAAFVLAVIDPDAAEGVLD